MQAPGLFRTCFSLYSSYVFSYPESDLTLISRNSSPRCAWTPKGVFTGFLTICSLNFLALAGAQEATPMRAMPDIFLSLLVLPLGGAYD